MNWLIGALIQAVVKKIEQLVAGLMLITTNIYSFKIQGFIDWFKSGDENLLTAFYSNVIIPFAIALLILNMVYHLYRSMFIRNASEADEPVRMFFGAGIAMILIMMWGSLFHYFEDIFMGAFEWVTNTAFNFDGIVKNASTGLANGGDTGSWVNASNGLELKFGDGTLLMQGNEIILVIELIALLILLWNFFKVQITYAERWVQYGIIVFFFPLTFAALPSSQTRDISKKAVRLFLSTCLILFITAMLCYLFLAVFAKAVLFDMGDDIENPFIQNIMEFFIAIAIARLISRLDELFNRLGLTAIDSGVNPGDFTAPIVAAASMALAPAKAIRSIDGARKALQGAASAVKGAKDTQDTLTAGASAASADGGGAAAKGGGGVSGGVAAKGATGKASQSGGLGAIGAKAAKANSASAGKAINNAKANLGSSAGKSVNSAIKNSNGTLGANQSKPVALTGSDGSSIGSFSPNGDGSFTNMDTGEQASLGDLNAAAEGGNMQEIAASADANDSGALVDALDGVAADGNGYAIGDEIQGSITSDDADGAISSDYSFRNTDDGWIATDSDGNQYNVNKGELQANLGDNSRADLYSAGSVYNSPEFEGKQIINTRFGENGTMAMMVKDRNSGTITQNTYMSTSAARRNGISVDNKPSMRAGSETYIRTGSRKIENVTLDQHKNVVHAEGRFGTGGKGGRNTA